MSSKAKILGERFGRLVVVDEAPPHILPSGRACRRAVCACDCGNEKTVHVTSLRGGLTLSCGCLHTEKQKTCGGNYGTRTHKIWENMIQRGRGHGHFKERYFDRGIRVCDRWKSFNNFLKDMGECPAGQTIERINNDGNYEPTNCRWATRAEQNRNTSRNVFVIINGEQMCFKDALKKMNIRKAELKKKIQNGEVQKA